MIRDTLRVDLTDLQSALDDGRLGSVGERVLAIRSVVSEQLVQLVLEALDVRLQVQHKPVDHARHRPHQLGPQQLVTCNMRNMCMCVGAYLFQFRIETNKV